MDHLIRLRPRSKRTRNLLFALSLLLIGAVPACAQESGPTPRFAATPSPVTATPTASPTAVPSVTGPSSTPSAATTPATSPGTQGNTGTPPANQNVAQTSGCEWLVIEMPGGYKVEGPVWFVLIVFVGFMILILILARMAREKLQTMWSTSKWKWIIVFLVSILVFFFTGTLAGTLIGSKRSEPGSFQVVMPTPAPTPHISTPTATPTSTPTPGATPTPIPTPSTMPTPIPTQSPTTTPTPTSIPTPLPLSVSNVRVPTDDQVAGLGDTIIITIKNLKQELAREPAPNSERIDPRKYVLFLDDMEVKKLYPVALDPNQEALTYKLSHTAESKDVWTNLLAGQKNPTRQTKASVGLEGKTPLPNGQNFNLSIYRRGWLNLGIVGFLVALGIFLRLASKTSIIRDSGPPEPPPGSFRPYSLARAQVAWWFFIILSSFFFIALVTQDFDTITNSSLVLLGIGTGTALGAAMVDANKRESTNSALLTLKPQQARLVETVAQLKAQVKELEAKRDAKKGDLTESDLSILNATKQELATKDAELVQVDRQVADAASALNSPVSEGFVKDILSDVNGITFHRFQMVVWTIVLGVIFGWSVWKRLTIPEFSDTLLALMGISAGTYIGFKFPERQTAPGPQQPTPSSQPATKPQQPAPVQPPPN